MKKIMAIFSALILFVVFAAGAKAPDESALVSQPDVIEKGTGLVKVQGDRFITDLKYNSDDNFLHKNVYAMFGVNVCYVHPEVYKKLMKLAPLLEKMKLKMVFFDCYRPLEVQEAMWKILPDTKYVANPKTGSNHNKAIALDCGLADETGKYLEFPTMFDSFEKKAWLDYECADDEVIKCQNRETLKKLMEDAGFKSQRTEWWHYQLENSKAYPIISLKNVEEKNE
jgi:zinc D-Ala-D-Ala dipeptidase